MVRNQGEQLNNLHPGKHQLANFMKPKITELLTIGDLAKSAGVNIETIRFYQRRGLLTEPKRPLGGIRHYGEADSARIRFIKSAQKLGFNLDEIIILLTLDDGTQCKKASKIAQQKLIEIQTKIAELQRMEKTLSNLISECENASGQVCCPIIASLHE
jgi:MerR family mercuric resistance operon transcriptional regulator